MIRYFTCAPMLADAPGWTVHDVLAHLTLSTRQSLASVFVRVMRAGGDFNKAEAAVARKRAATYAPIVLIEQLRATAGADRRLTGSHPLDPLVDILAHGQDIARPLGLHHELPVERVLPALWHVWASKFYGPQKRFAGLRFTATDADWSAGVGSAVVAGPIGDLFLLMTGRAAGLAGLSGPGVAQATLRV